MAVMMSEWNLIGMHSFLCTNFSPAWPWQLKCAHKGENLTDPHDSHTPGSWGHHNLRCFPWQITAIMHCSSCSWPLQLHPSAWDWVVEHETIVSCVTYKGHAAKQIGKNSVWEMVCRCRSENDLRLGSWGWSFSGDDTQCSNVHETSILKKALPSGAKLQIHRVSWYGCYGRCSSHYARPDERLGRRPSTSLAFLQ